MQMGALSNTMSSVVFKITSPLFWLTLLLVLFIKLLLMRYVLFILVSMLIFVVFYWRHAPLSLYCVCLDFMCVHCWRVLAQHGLMCSLTCLFVYFIQIWTCYHFYIDHMLLAIVCVNWQMPTSFWVLVPDIGKACTFKLERNGWIVVQVERHRWVCGI